MAYSLLVQLTDGHRPSALIDFPRMHAEYATFPPLRPHVASSVAAGPRLHGADTTYGPRSYDAARRRDTGRKRSRRGCGFVASAVDASAKQAHELEGISLRIQPPSTERAFL